MNPIAGVWSDGTPTDVESVDDALEVFDDLLECYSGDGQRGALASWWGPPINWDAFDPDRKRVNGPLRIDTWPELDLAAVRWEPTGEVGTEPGVTPPEGALVVMESAQDGLYPSVPAALVRCSIGAARQAVATYIGTGQRPESVEWQAMNVGGDPWR